MTSGQLMIFPLSKLTDIAKNTSHVVTSTK